MFKRVFGHFRRQPVAYVALFVALAGTAGATAPGLFIRPSDTVPAGDLAGSTYGNPLIAAGAVTGGKLANGAVTDGKLASGAVSTAKFAPGAQAPDSAKLGGQPATDYVRWTDAHAAFASAFIFGSAPTPGQVGDADSSCILGEIKLMAGSAMPTNWVPADGQLLPITRYDTLFSLLGTTYGGDGTTTFALPDLRSAAPRGDGPAGVSYNMCLDGTYP
jgi:hypothetical protein